jgi:transposase
MRVVVSSEFRPQCHYNYVHIAKGKTRLRKWHVKASVCLCYIYLKIFIFFLDTILSNVLNKIDMSTKPSDDSRVRSLREQRALHRHPEKIQDEAFRSGDFFDPRDLVQVRYEMLRRHRVDGKAVSEVVHSFGISRQAFYVTDASFRNRGLPGLLPRRRGPRRAHKCTDEILDFVEQWRRTTDGKETIVEAVRRRFEVTINPRSIERAMKRRKKKPPTQMETQG